jgi:hypothetical protein
VKNVRLAFFTMSVFMYSGIDFIHGSEMFIDELRENVQVVICSVDACTYFPLSPFCMDKGMIIRQPLS